MTTSPLLDATGVAKNYGAVAALRNASLSVLPGEVHALMGANGAGKSTLVKILTGAIKADAGRILIRGQQLDVRSPAAARRAGLLPVYQEPSLIPDLDVLSNLRLTGTPVEPFRAWVRELGIPDLDIRETARHIPLAILRVLDLARALAVEPDVLLLDEMTAALPANLAEKVLEVVRRQGDAGRSVIFISHRFVEISALCDRATVLRDGSTVGVVDIEPGVEEGIVEMMLGTRIEKTRVAARAANDVAVAAGGRPRLSVRNLQLGTKLNDVSFDLANGEVVGVFALEGQGQDELFAALAGSIRPTGGTIDVDGAPVKFSHPSDAIQAGIAYVPGDRTEALAMQRSVRENIALPFSAGLRKWGPIRMRREEFVISGAIGRLQIDTRAQGEVQRLSGGNQQKVTIARWIAANARTILCFDPTRGIDVGTKQEIYKLLRELAGQGKSVLFYTSEMEEVQRVCDRVIVIFGGRVVDTFPVEEADEAALMRAAYGLPRGARADVGILAEVKPASDAEVAP
ncbi:MULTISPECIES: sugar ABC transporter ATP-binding protein [unclassified Mesorhizobium]|uniref:sugar ABC transporter ATP-binding protein n=7 Tax=Mesorhizobium TaxID=68287 RepID=UPI000F7609BB|nr:MULTISPECIES: sugar ABC transporter ATP-binding protein [unclassified Mesorhizobium]AZO03150.1 sugar ABC transporter ATP-binding protein [Mesorhizobium sp. M2A.F.Ca.ET.043.02.1.1]RUW42876.1 sugar ABC transporter ATP-binding protein [Mesorhizobium sp. M2A.F.Ca.ET.015.02.1.1]RVC98133.1 sugar ABC transporter ATP-binding protein [Mesorhizobium sp. M2A.F.Ca.ET.017.03.2.1]RVC99478.1 sugar ABC transporter ATP-binding protein [Mesorhizobium sp. M2A.F.Ca.ET.029.05.1.1]RWB58494.1 MAG: sugar ABC trans